MGTGAAWCPESVGDALQSRTAAKYGEVKCLGLSRPNRKLRKLAGETKRKNGPSPCGARMAARQTQCLQAARIVSGGTRGSSSGHPCSWAIYQKLTVPVTLIFLRVTVKKEKTIVMDGGVNNLIGPVIRSQLSETLFWEKRT